MPSPFKLQSVLEYRKLQRDEAQRRLAEVLQQEAEIAAEIVTLSASIRQLYKEFEELQKQGVTCDELTLYDSHCQHQEKLLEELKEQLEQIREEINLRRQALQEADMDQKVLEKLKEKKIQEEIAEEHRQETIQTDEIAIRNHERDR